MGYMNSEIYNGLDVDIKFINAHQMIGSPDSLLITVKHITQQRDITIILKKNTFQINYILYL